MAKTSKKSKKPKNRYELITCGWKGHALVGTDADEILPDHHALVRAEGDLRWHRCLRCDGWIPKEKPAQPTGATVPPRDEIEVPLRGPMLRDRYILRIISVERASHVVLFGGLAFAIFFFASHKASLQADYTRLINGFYGASSAKVQHGFLGKIQHYFFISPNHLKEAAGALAVYATLEGIEAVGLWFAKRWAEYLTFIATAMFIPFEVYELTGKFSTFKLATFIVNVAVAVYLLLAKRLFGARGGQKAEEERRHLLGSWPAIDSATPAFTGSVS